MDKITIDATIDSMIGVNLERKEKNINHSNVPLRGIYDFEIDNVNNESMLKSAILKSIKKLSVSNKILLNGWIDIIHKGRRVYRATYYRLSVKDIINGEYTK